MMVILIRIQSQIYTPIDEYSSSEDFGESGVLLQRAGISGLFRRTGFSGGPWKSIPGHEAVFQQSDTSSH
jgi:hypothetical protein